MISAEELSYEDYLLDTIGYFPHFETEENGLVNYHTHGVQNNFQHMDFQIVLPISPELATLIFCDLVEMVKSGESFKNNMYVENILDDQPIQLIKARETGRSVLRVIFPDDLGYFPKNQKCDLYYSLQKEVRFTYTG